MKRLDSISDEMRGVVTYDLGGNRMVTLDIREVQQYGATTILKRMGVELSTEPVPVMQYGKRVGTVPGDFDLAFARSRSPFFNIRPHDLVREGDVWVAAKSLGASDLDCIVGFRRDHGHDQRQEEIRDDALQAFLGVGSK